MFTGLIEEVATVVGLRTSKTGCELQIAAPVLSAEAGLGASIAVNGCCLTLTSRQDRQLTFDLLNETLERTNLRQLRPDRRVNLERALRPTDRFGGHFVQGHVDCTAHIVDFAKQGTDYRLEIELPARLARYVAVKGSIAINGVSLTIADVLPRSFVAWIIPHTRSHTNLEQAQPGDFVNLEFDILAKYVERLLPYRRELKSASSPRRIRPLADRS